MPYTYEYPRPMVTVDAILVAKNQSSPKILLINRKHDPFAGSWALPGGFVNENEAPEDAVLRELEEETGVRFSNFTQFRTYGQYGRDPRGHTISVVFYAFTENIIEATGTDDAADAKWFSLHQLPIMAFDHAQIIKDAMKHLNL